MPIRPARLWKDLRAEQRLTAAEAFWREDEADAGMQHADAMVAIARRFNFRPKFVQALSIERRAKLLAQLPDVSDAVATRALIAYHFTAKRDLMGAFLDEAGIAHENGLIREESVTPPAADTLTAAVAKVRETFPRADVDLYLRVLAALDEDTWAGLEPVLAAQA